MWLPGEAFKNTFACKQKSKINLKSSIDNMKQICFFLTISFLAGTARAQLPKLQMNTIASEAISLSSHEKDIPKYGNDPVPLIMPECFTKDSLARAPLVAPLKKRVLRPAGIDNTLGIKLLWGISLTGRKFLSDYRALEAIFNFRSHSRDSKYYGLTALYECHNELSDIDGLSWFAGGGITGGRVTTSNNDGAFDVGLSGIVGLEYQFIPGPFAISIDWQPTIFFSRGSSFVGRMGGIGIKYSFN